MKPEDVRVGDLVTNLDGYWPKSRSERVIAVNERGFQLPSMPGSHISRWVYFGAVDDVEVEGENETALPEDAFEMISDALLLMKETLQERGAPNERVSALLKDLHRFSAPDTATDVIVRPRRVR